MASTDRAIEMTRRHSSQPLHHVTITGTITQPIINDLPFGFIVFINDGSGEIHAFVAASTGIDVSGLSPGQTIEVTGFSGQFASDFEVDPRNQDDIRVIN